MPDLSTQPEVSEAQLDENGELGVGFTESNVKKTGRLPWANLKAWVRSGLTPKAWVGTRRENATESTVTTSGGFASVLTLSITPSAANAQIRVRGNVFGDLVSPHGENSRIVFYAKYKSGTGSYRAMHDSSKTRTTLKGHLSNTANYLDWIQGSGFFEFFITAPNTDRITVNIEGNPRIANTDQSQMYVNRNTSKSRDYELISFLELTEFKVYGTNNPIAIETTATADPA